VVIDALPDPVTEYPLVEPLEGLLMRALHVAETLDRYPPAPQRLMRSSRFVEVSPLAEARLLTR
jgi:hypothetical protein